MIAFLATITLGAATVCRDSARADGPYDVAQVRSAFATVGLRLSPSGLPLSAGKRAALVSADGDVAVDVYRKEAPGFVFLLPDQRFKSQRNVAVVYPRRYRRLKRINEALRALARIK